MPQLFSYGIVGLLFVISAWAWSVLPANQEMAIHWNVYGKPDGFAPKAVGLIVLPVIMLFVCLLFWRLAGTGSVEGVGAAEGISAQRWEQAKPAAYISIFGAQIVLFEAHCAIVFTAMGYAVPVTQLLLGSVGLLLAAIGAVLASGKTTRNPWVGIRTPWTMNDDRVWDKTNRLGGIIMMLSGIVTACGAVLNPIVAAVGILGGVIILLVATYGLSYYWAKNAS